MKIEVKTDDLVRFRKELAQKRSAFVRSESKSLKAIQERFLKLIDDGFKKARDPYNKRWKPANDDTPLIETGRLRRSIRAKIKNSAIRFFDTSGYGAIHQNGIGVTRRQFLPNQKLPENWSDVVRNEMNKRFTEAFG